MWFLYYKIVTRKSWLPTVTAANPTTTKGWLIGSKRNKLTQDKTSDFVNGSTKLAPNSDTVSFKGK